MKKSTRLESILLILVAFSKLIYSTSAIAAPKLVPSSYCPLFLSQTTLKDGQGKGKSAFKSADSKQFRDALLRTEHDKYPNRIYVRDIEEYHEILDEGGMLFLSHDEKIGFGIDHKMELISLFNYGTEKGMGAEAVKEAIKLGANKLFCWGRKLTKYYEQFGFQVKRSANWKEEYWLSDNIPRGFKPKIYYMELVVE